MSLMEAMMKHADQELPDQRPFRFVSGLSGHEHIFDVRYYPLSCIPYLFISLTAVRSPTRRRRVGHTPVCVSPSSTFAFLTCIVCKGLHSWTALRNSPTLLSFISTSDVHQYLVTIPDKSFTLKTAPYLRPTSFLVRTASEARSVRRFQVIPRASNVSSLHVQWHIAHCFFGRMSNEQGSR